MHKVNAASQFIRTSIIGSIGFVCMLGTMPSLSARVLTSTGTSVLGNSEKTGDIAKDPSDESTLRFLICRQGTKAVEVEVEAQDDDFWRSVVVQADGWECSPAVDLIQQAEGDPQVSCEPVGGTLEILTITWLTGEGASEQIQAWKEAIGSKPDWGCIVREVDSLSVDDDSEDEKLFESR